MKSITLSGSNALFSSAAMCGRAIALVMRWKTKLHSPRCSASSELEGGGPHLPRALVDAAMVREVALEGVGTACQALLFGLDSGFYQAEALQSIQSNLPRMDNFNHQSAMAGLRHLTQEALYMRPASDADIEGRSSVPLNCPLLNAILISFEGKVCVKDYHDCRPVCIPITHKSASTGWGRRLYDWPA
jgi:hypothetical protein